MQTIDKIFEDLKGKYANLTDAELLNSAIQLQRNEILKQGLVIDKDSPSGLEAVAIQLGYKGTGGNITDSLDYIGNAIEAK